jgi:hypothetical protein
MTFLSITMAQEFVKHVISPTHLTVEVKIQEGSFSCSHTTGMWDVNPALVRQLV